MIPQILVVDDNEMNRDMLSRRLKRQNYDVLMAEDGVKALDVLKNAPVDLVLLDIMMPNMSGYEVLEQIKRDPNMQHLPVIMISAVDDLDSVVRCIELGAEDYLFKPFNPVLLKARVSASLDKRRAPAAPVLTDIAAHLQAAQTALWQVQAALPPALQPPMREALTSLDRIHALLHPHGESS